MALTDFPINLPAPLPPRPSPRRVIILGAGLAGLAAALELHAAGHRVTVLEARDRPGGRVFTLREPFASGLYAEAGATYFPASHPLPLAYAARFGLPLQPVPVTRKSACYWIAEKLRTAHPADWADIPFALTAPEKALGPGGMLARYLAPTARLLAGGALSDQEQNALDQLSLAEFLKRERASRGAIDLLRLGPLGLAGDGPETVSALVVLRDLGTYLRDPGCFALAGGNDALPRALAGTLGDRVCLGHRVLRIEQGDEVRVTAWVQSEAGNRISVLAGDYLLCTIPFPVLRTLHVWPPFSPRTTRLIEELSSTSVMQLFVQAPRALWSEGNELTRVATDLPVMTVEESMASEGGQGILRCSLAGAGARTCRQLSLAARRLLTLENLDRLFPGVQQSCEKWTSWDWDEDPFARGAYAWYRPGQGNYPENFPVSEGRCFFAGEHLSPWPGWTQGALSSGLRAARLIHEAP